ncbi:M23 family metallopeptidase [Streptomyces sporangiiformans]|uniref:M23 family metallopeptidase n=1 Tax=Streptomyces sporangiiformans TaxID=2315329 RepID=A0A505DJT4_9ACTN|nr:M23 family metallopeptidase [Streptomyces sporangiiformans]
MRAERCTRCLRTWLALVLCLTATALGAALPPAAARDSGMDGPSPPKADGAVPAVGRAWPVGTRPRVTRGWEPPASTYGRGHRGVDLAAPSGTPVRAVAPGRVSFAGRVAGRGVVSVELDGTGDPPVRTTYEPVRATARKGAKVTAGEVVGVVEPAGSHCATPCLHWGLRRADAYLDPLSVLPPWLLHGGPSRLLPVIGVPEGPVDQGRPGDA